MEDNKVYPEQPDEETVNQAESAEDLHREEQSEAPAVSDTDQAGSVQDVQFVDRPERQEVSSNETARRGEICRNDASQPGADYRNNTQYQNGGHPNNMPYQNGNYQNHTAYQNNNYQSGQPYQDGSYPYSDYQNASYGGYAGSACSGTGGQNYDSGYQQYNGVQSYQNAYQNGYQNTYQNAYQNNGQAELEEPVRISEWVLAMVLMMIPCVNIIMMFVWAFSSTEKKSKSNFFKAYLIFFGISMGVLLLVWIAIVFFAMLAY